MPLPSWAPPVGEDWGGILWTGFFQLGPDDEETSGIWYVGHHLYFYVTPHNNGAACSWVPWVMMGMSYRATREGLSRVQWPRWLFPFGLVISSSGVK